MPKVRLQKELMNIKRESEAAFQIREEFVRWDNVKTAHDLMDDMEVARMLLDCYDLVGGNFLIWSDQAKLAPPPLYATLRLQHVTSEGFEVLQEIKALGAWKRDTAELSQRKSKRKQTHVRRIAQVQVKKEVETDDDEDFISDDDDDYMPEDEIIPQRVIKSPRSARGRKAKKPVASSTRALEAPESGNNDGGHGTSSKPAARKRGRPRKGEVRPPPPKRGRKRKPKPEEEMYGLTETPDMRPYVKQKTSNDDRMASQPKPPGGKGVETPIKERRSRILYQCKLCGTLCNSFKKFRRHYHQHLRAKDPAADTEEPVHGNKKHYSVFYHCKPCNKIFDEEEIIGHRKTHNDIVNEVCDICGKLFTVRGSWRKHVRTHIATQTGRVKQCKLCYRTFPLISDLKRHMKCHSKERPYICDVCGKGFKERNALLKHCKIHTNTRPNTCHYCGKGFIQPYRLREHMRTHTGEKPFLCDICNTSFAQKQALSVHRKAVHGISQQKDPKSKVLKEYDEVNPRDPKIYENCTVRVSPEGDSVDISWLPEKPKKADEVKEERKAEIAQPLVSYDPKPLPHVDKAPQSLPPAPVQTLDPNMPGTSNEALDASLHATDYFRKLYFMTGINLPPTALQNVQNKGTSEGAGVSYTSL